MKAGLGLSVIAVCASCAPRLPALPPSNPSTEALQLRSALTVYAVGRGNRTVLFDGAKHATLASIVSVPKDQDIVVSISKERIAQLGGSISVRARVLGTTPVEIPVENYTVVNEKELKEERKVLLASDTDFFRDTAHRGLIEHVGQLQQSATEYKSFLDATAMAGLHKLYSTDQVKGWLDGKALPSDPFETKREESDEDAAIALFREALTSAQGAELKKATMTALESTRADINALFVFSDLASQLNDSSLLSVRRNAQRLISDLSQWRAQMSPFTQSDPNILDECNKTRIGYATTAKITVKGAKDAKVDIPTGTKLIVQSDAPDSSTKIVYPPQFEGFTIALATEAKKLDFIQSFSDRRSCILQKVPRLAESLRPQLVALAAIHQVTQADLVDTGQTVDCPAKPTVRSSESSVVSPAKGLLSVLEEMKRDIRCGIQAKLLDGLRDARVRLSQVNLVHGNQVEIIVRLTVPGTTLRAGEERADVDVEERVVIRAVDQGFDFHASPQFALIKRVSDVRVANANEVPSNFKPAAGVVLAYRFRIRHPAGDWFLPSVGIGAHVVDFDPSKSIELGVGPTVGFLNDYVHAGVGWNLSVDEHRQYVWISLDFLKTFDTFGSFFGEAH